MEVRRDRHPRQYHRSTKRNGRRQRTAARRSDLSGAWRTAAMPIAEGTLARPRRFPMLPLEGDWDRASELIAKYFPIVTHIVRRYHCAAADRDDLYQEGCLVILEAARDHREGIDGDFDRFIIRAIERRLRQCR